MEVEKDEAYVYTYVCVWQRVEVGMKSQRKWYIQETELREQQKYFKDIGIALVSITNP